MIDASYDSSISSFATETAKTLHGLARGLASESEVSCEKESEPGDGAEGRGGVSGVPDCVLVCSGTRISLPGAVPMITAPSARVDSRMVSAALPYSAEMLSFLSS